MASKVRAPQGGAAGAAHRVVVGVDGSPSSMEALAWAAAEAQLRNAVLEIVHVDFAREEAMRALAPGMLATERSVLEQALKKAKTLAPRTLVIGRMCDPPAADALIAESAGAQMLVVGTRGLSGLKELTLGSVSKECAHRALCPVVIIRPPLSPRWTDDESELVATTSGADGV